MRKEIIEFEVEADKDAKPGIYTVQLDLVSEIGIDNNENPPVTSYNITVKVEDKMIDDWMIFLLVGVIVGIVVIIGVSRYRKKKSNAEPKV